MKTSFERLLEKYPGIEVRSVRQELDAQNFEMQRRKNKQKQPEGGAIGVVWFGLDRVVLAKRTQALHPGYSLLGGTVERGQHFDDAFVREALEEAGMRVRIGRLVVVEQKIFVSPTGQELPMNLAVFEASALPGEKIVATPDAEAEGLEVEAFALNELPSEMILADKEKLEMVIAQHLE